MRKRGTNPGVGAMVLGALLVISAMSAADHDLTCYEIIQPDGEYVQAGLEFNPVLGIANLGSYTEPSSGFFPVTFLVVDMESADTTFRDSIMISDLAPGDSIEVEIPTWTPEGICREDEPFVYYEILGIVRLGDDDENPDNDTIKDTVTCLFEHDVGCTDIKLDPGPTTPPDIWEPGTKITATVTVVNYGINTEYNVPVRLQVIDKYAHPDTFVINHVEYIDTLFWMGSEEEQSCSATVVFPEWEYPDVPGNCVVVKSTTELEEDLCPDDDYEVIHHNGPPCDEAVEEGSLRVSELDLQVIPGISGKSDFDLRFSLPVAEWVKIDVFDASGRWVTAVASDYYFAGHHSVSWNGRDDAGHRAPSGAYIVRMETANLLVCRKLTVVK